MGSRCIICYDNRRPAIEKAMAECAIRAVSERFQIGVSSVHRHKVNHLRIALAAVARERALASAAGVVDLVQNQIANFEELLAQAKRQRSTAEQRKIAAEIVKAAMSLADLIGARAPSVSISLQAQTPSREEAIQIALDTLRAFAPHTLAAESRITEPETAPALLLEGELPEEPGSVKNVSENDDVTP